MRRRGGATPPHHRRRPQLIGDPSEMTLHPRQKAKASAPRPKDPWCRPDWPTKGDHRPQKIWLAVGFALSEWEQLEGILGSIFGILVEGPVDNPAASQAYGAVRTFEGRKAMLLAAARVFFLKYPRPVTESMLNKVVGNAMNYAGRRNDIAHGSVFSKLVDKQTGKIVASGYVLYPSDANSKDRDSLNRPLYAYVASDIMNFGNRFSVLHLAAFEVWNALLDLISETPADASRDRDVQQASETSPGAN